MDYIEWNDNCSVGVKQFDEHHKHLFDLLKKVYLTCDHKDQTADSEAIINELVDYAAYHFAAEERLMDATGYYDTTEHKLEHQRFVERVAGFQRNLDENKQIYLIDLIGFLGNWLIHHIMEVDKKMGLSLNKATIY